MIGDVSYRITIIATTCGECGVLFGLSDDFIAERRRTGATWYCPNGHGRVYRDTNEKRLQRELEQANRRIEWLKQDVANGENQRRALKGKITKITKRVHAGVCPHCDRTFQQLARHMESKHADQKGSNE